MKLFRKRDFITVVFILAFSAVAITLFYTILKPAETLPIYQPAEVNEKLVDRGARIIQNITGKSYEKSLETLIRANKSVKTAIVMIMRSCDIIEAQKKLSNANGMLREVIEGSDN